MGRKIMRGISYIYLGKRYTHRIEEAFIENGYRILVDEEGKKESSAWIGSDGESDRIFPTHQEAEKALEKKLENLEKYAEITDLEILN